MSLSNTTHISIIGLGYVGLPLAVSLARHFPVVGFDISARRIEELKASHDRTREVSAETLRVSRLTLTAHADDIAQSDIYIVTVPTPVDSQNRPDLHAVREATKIVGTRMGEGAVVVYESTVYPGVTEHICGPILEEVSGLRCGRDFFLGYSPERINPGDKEHTIERITKVVSGQTPAVAHRLAKIYGSINGGNVFIARDIKTAEAAKVIENAQRDINIAFINEVSIIFQKLGISAYDVLDAAGTKWNFLRFTPGLVGGHCIGVDPFYLAHRAQELGHHPEVILAGRRINDSMGSFIAQQIDALLPRSAAVLVLGLTFKENVPDLRNSKVVDIIQVLRQKGHTVRAHDPIADDAEAKEHYGIDLCQRLDQFEPFDAVVGAVAHAEYSAFSMEMLANLVKPDGVIADIKGMWRHISLPNGVRRWEL